jgi:hypothetical protein
MRASAPFRVMLWRRANDHKERPSVRLMANSSATRWHTMRSDMPM